MRNSILWLFLFILCFSANLSALDKKVEVGSEKMKSNQTIMEFASRYTAAINTKNIEALVDLMSPASLKCYKESKHPEYYQEEFKKWFKADIKSLMEIRKYTTYDHKFHELMNYPELPTHVAVFDSEELHGTRSFRGWQSIEIVERDTKYFLAYRCM